MEKIKEILEDQNNDRYIFISYLNGCVAGVNFHQGLGHIDYEYFKSCKKLTKIYKAIKNHSQCECQISLVKEAIELYLELFHNN